MIAPTNQASLTSDNPVWTARVRSALMEAHLQFPRMLSAPAVDPKD